jgi:hypothetical protein
MKPSQLSIVAGKARKFYDEAAKERQGERTDKHPGKVTTMSSRARDAAGKAVGVSGTLVDRG